MKLADLQRELEPLTKRLAHDLAAILFRTMGEEVDAVRIAARGYLAQQLDALTAVVDEIAPAAAEVVHSEPPPDDDEIADQAEEVAHRDPKPANVSQRRCSACKEIGHRADRCPDREQTAPVVNATRPSVNSEPPPFFPKADRFARIEAAASRRRGAE